ncbi:alpha-amylase family glycosyl hydrolase [Streptomyces rhizosphaericus]|uniref:Oligo-1,6-glucosidase n=2 Tax=Streptomyces violaceusniger group TaxID=2839105 RepID=A0A6G4ALZ4_9ACTN|nr:alpha-amylase family glycosyl hydrolase [Streptomyces rhizosphaericus]NEW73709.1 oligo-1,6-glucosidase [Streptomyces rhizosphaericus]
MPQSRTALSWLSDAVLYQIYPQSFADSDGDGIGDLAGIVERLDYLAWLGVDTVWLNPCFASEFGDGGYDVVDYLSIAPRYGTNEDAAKLIDAANSRGIRVMFDLVPGHTSHRHPWFQESANTPGDHRYIWSDRIASPMREWIPNQGARGGFYRANFFPIQPALNFGYARSDEAEPWRQPVDADGPMANRAALRDVMAFWFDRGVSGFRVDMAFSLVKDDPGQVETGNLWRQMREWIDRSYPHCALLAEWGDPRTSIPAGFHSDFFLHFDGDALRSLWDNNTGSIGPWSDGQPCYFDPDGKGSMETFLTAWNEAEAAADGGGLVALPTANHDFSRLTCGPRTRDMVAPAFAFQLTWPSLPVIYYGDEIGMRYLPGLPDKEGSQLDTQARQGSRTPMQWDDGPNAGFSTAPADRLYLPIDPDPDRPTVASAQAVETSLLRQVRTLIHLRKQTPSLGADAPVRVLHRDYPFVYTRGDSHLVVINGCQEPARAPLSDADGARPLAVHGVEIAGGEVRTQGFSYGIFELPAS